MNTSRTFHPFCHALRFLVAFPVAYLLMPFQVLGQVAVAPGSGNTRTYTTAGGTAVVDIATPNSVGLSQNKYTAFNAPSQGLVLNNGVPTQFTTPSQLAGTVTSNFNLTPTAAAKVILNEVVGGNTTTLAGFVEVAGAKADVVIANPNGITVNGAGFLNTSQVTLATGTPVIDSTGALATLRIGSGTLLVTGTGLNASTVDYLNLLGRSVVLNGAVNAGDLTVGGGAHDFDVATRTVKAATGALSGASPAYAIDSSALGGMYAGRIRLLATEAGVGVRLLGDVAATKDDFTIDAAGKVQLSGRAYAERDARLAGSGGVEVSGASATLTAKRDLTLAAGPGAVTLTDAALVAGRDLTVTGASLLDTSAAAPSSANRFATGNLSLVFTGSAAASQSAFGAGGALNVTAGSVALSNLASFYSGADTAAATRTLTFRATAGDLDAGNAQLTSPTALTLTADLGALRFAASGAGTGVQAGGEGERGR